MSAAPSWWRRLVQSCAHELGVADTHSILQWLLRLFVLPPSQRPPWRLPGWLRKAGACSNTWLAWLMRPLHRLHAGYLALDLRTPARQLERGSERLAAWPGWLRSGLLLLCALLFWLAATTPLSTAQQCAFVGLMWLSSLLLRRMPGNLATLALIGFSLVASARYIWWRLTETLGFDSVVEALLGYGLLAAEGYTWIIMLLGYLQNAWPLKRMPAPLPDDRALWPSVDVFIPTYNEPLHVVKPTVYAALGLDWPRDKLNIYILDDGRRPAFREFASQAGVRYIARSDNAHAKAGNLNHALRHTHGDYVAIFDCDHIATRSFLQTTMGWFLRDPKCAMVQTPHHFFSPDPFERNLGTFREVPNEGSLFYGLVQDGNDLWNATFFCGSCAVMRRAPLLEVGGIAVETVTEDAHTALKMHRRGYTTAYLNVTQAAGLATESLSGHIGQRIRWARGMAQIFRIDNPLFGRGLSLFQRLCYSNAMLHFFHGIPRLVFLTAPLGYLYFGLYVINASAWMIALYALPHIAMAQVANSRMQGRYRHSFWAEVYESVLAWYIMLPTTVAFFNPRHGKFNVTVKGGLVEKSFFDWSISRPYLALILANFGGCALGVFHLLCGDSRETSTIIMNLAWAFYNLLMLGTSVGIAEETRQVRQAHRVMLRMPATLQYGSVGIAVETHDYSTGGFGLTLPEGAPLPALGSAVSLRIGDGAQIYSFPAHVSSWNAPRLGIRLDELTMEQEQQLIHCTFGRADAWLHWNDPQMQDRPLSSLAEILRFGFKGYVRLFKRLAGMRLPSAAPLT